MVITVAFWLLIGLFSFKNTRRHDQFLVIDGYDGRFLGRSIRQGSSNTNDIACRLIACGDKCFSPIEYDASEKNILA